MRLALCLPAALFGALLSAFPISGARAADREYGDRIVDQAALSSKQSAIRELKAMLQQRRGTSDEPRLEMALAELQRDCADFEFRVAHGDALFKGHPANLADYRMLLGDTIRLLTGFIQRYPSNTKVSRAYYLRGKAFLELGRKSEASADFRTVIQRYPNNPDFKFATLAEIDLLMQLKDYKGALHYVDVLHATPSDREYYAISLDRSAWANYHLGDIPQALRSLEGEVRYLNDISRSKGSPSDRENAYNGIALFYASAMERKMPGYTASNAGSYFRSISPGAGAAGLGSMMIQLAYLMRSKGWDDDLESLEKSAIGAALAPSLDPSSQLDLILVTLENQVNRYRYHQLGQSVADLDQWRSRNRGLSLGSNPSSNSDRMRRAIADAATSLQHAFVESKETPATQAPIGRTLISLYALVLELPAPANGESLDKQMKIHFDMAEISFTLKDYEHALFHYRWAIEHQRSGTARSLVAQSELKAISSKYELLSAQGLFPKDLRAQSLRASSSRRLPDDAKVWIQWVDDFMGAKTNPDRPSGEVFLFEANRLLYSFGDVSEATSRMLGEIGKYTDAKFAMASAALVLDTYVASEEWDQTYDVGTRVASARKWDPDFQRTVNGVIGNSYFKMIELQYKSKNYSAVIDRSGKFLSLYPQNSNRSNCILLAANSALALKNKTLALQYFSMLGSSKPEITPQMTLIRIALAEEKRDYASAVKYLEAYLALPKAQADSKAADVAELRKKAALYEFLDSDSEPVSWRLRGKGVCVDETEAYCEHLDAMAELSSGKSDAAATKRAFKGGADSAIWSVIALRNPTALNLGERDRILDVLSKHWESEEPIAKFLLIPYLPSVVLKNLELARADVSSTAKIRQIRKKLIDKRVKLIGDMEKMSEKSMKLPWISVRVGALRELAGVYSDFSSDIRKIRAPKGLTGQDLIDYQGTIAQMTGFFDKKSADFEKQALDLAAGSPPEPAPESYQDAVSGLVARFEQSAAKDSGSPSQLLISRWADSLRTKHWGRVAFFMGQMKVAGISQENCKLAEAVSVYSAGARAEGIAEIRGVGSELSGSLKGAVADVLRSGSRLPAAAGRTVKVGGSS